MRLRPVLLLVTGLVMLALAVLNWRLLLSPVQFSFGLGSGELPMWVLLAVLPAMLIVVVSMYFGIWQRRVINDYRRVCRDLELHRSRAETTEGTRLAGLEGVFRQELGSLAQRMSHSLDELRSELRTTENSLAAHIGEMDDRLNAHTPVGGHIN